jgi:hypothetical protein
MCIDDCSAKWKEPYIAALLEIDSEKILSRIHDAKMAICDRVEELNGGGDVSERVALNRAMRALCELQDVYCGDSDNVLRQPRERLRAAEHPRACNAD